jgi:hypothetical protein
VFPRFGAAGYPTFENQFCSDEMLRKDYVIFTKMF